MSQRKLIRPKLSEVRTKRKRPSGPGRTPPSQQQMSRKPTPPEQTFAEVYYYLKQMHSKSPVVIVMKDGEELKGWIEWYDRDVIKLNRHEGPNLMLFKDGIKYIYKDEEHSGAEEREETTEE